MRALLIACLACGLLLGQGTATPPGAAASEKAAVDQRWRVIADDLTKTVFEGLAGRTGKDLRAFSLQTADDSALGKALASYLVTDFVHQGFAPAPAPSDSTISLRWTARLFRHDSLGSRGPGNATLGDPLGRGVRRLVRSDAAWTENAATLGPARWENEAAGTEVVVYLAVDVADKPCLRRVQAYFVSDADLPGHADAERLNLAPAAPHSAEGRPWSAPRATPPSSSLF